MKYINNNLIIEKVKVRDLAKKFGTPIYCYSYKKLKENVSTFKKNSLAKFYLLLKQILILR